VNTERVSPNRPVTITLSAGQANELTIPLMPAGTIAGRIFDRDGEPLANVNIQAFRYTYQDGQRVRTRFRERARMTRRIRVIGSAGPILCERDLCRTGRTTRRRQLPPPLSDALGAAVSVDARTGWSGAIATASVERPTL